MKNLFFMFLLFLASCGNKSNIDYGHQEPVSFRSISYSKGFDELLIFVDSSGKSHATLEHYSDQLKKSCYIETLISGQKYMSLHDVYVNQKSLVDSKFQSFIFELKQNFSCDGTPISYNLKTLKYTFDNGIDLTDLEAKNFGLTDAKKVNINIAFLKNEFNETKVVVNGYISVRIFNNLGLARTYSYNNFEISSSYVSTLTKLDIKHNVGVCKMAVASWLKDSGTLTLNYNTNSKTGKYGCWNIDQVVDESDVLKAIIEDLLP